MRRRATGSIALAMTLAVSVARATVGGPTTCDLPGWDAAAKRALAVQRIPGRPKHLVLFSFTGDPDEGGYETQEPVLVVPGETGTRILGGRASAH